MKSEDMAAPEVVVGGGGGTSVCGAGVVLKDDGMTDTAKTKLAEAADYSKYQVDPHKLDAFRKEAPWTTDAKFFKRVAISPSAVMKMMMHCQSGVDKGIAKGGNPIEVMGLLLGRPDPDSPRTLVITDAFALPIEGFETRVIADDQAVVNHMIALGECLERTRNEKFMGWYHSHPFDLAQHSHCFLSQTDLSTQLQWQRAEDPHGNPFVAIVVDPLRSIHMSMVELKAFRAYPPEYNSPVDNECPNGAIEVQEQARLEQWGSCWNRYYELKVEYYMSSAARGILEQLTQDYLWMRTLAGSSASSSNQDEIKKQLPERISKTAIKFQTLEQGVNKMSFSLSMPASAVATGTAAAAAGGSVGASSDAAGVARIPLSGSGSDAMIASAAVAATALSAGGGGSMIPMNVVGTTNQSKQQLDDFDMAVKDVVDMATEQIYNDTLTQTKRQIFTKK